MPVCWNGRRSGFKIRRWRHRVGSSPTTGTTTSEELSSIPFPRLRRAGKTTYPLSPSSFPNRRIHGDPPIWFKRQPGYGLPRCTTSEELSSIPFPRLRRAWRRARTARRTRLAGKTTYPLSPSSFPKRESHWGLPFRLWGTVRSG